MPGLDGTGPMGAGPMTGGGRGLCNPSGRYYGWTGFGRGYRAGLAPGFGWGRGYGRGFGWRGAYPVWGGLYGSQPYTPYGSPYAMNPQDEVNMLKDKADAIKSELDAINKRIEEIESESSET